MFGWLRKKRETIEAPSRGVPSDEVDFDPIGMPPPDAESRSVRHEDYVDNTPKEDRYKQQFLDASDMARMPKREEDEAPRERGAGLGGHASAGFGLLSMPRNLWRALPFALRVLIVGGLLFFVVFGVLAPLLFDEIWWAIRPFVW